MRLSIDFHIKANKDLGYLLRKFYPPPQSSALSTQPLRLNRQSKKQEEAWTFVPAFLLIVKSFCVFFIFHSQSFEIIEWL